MSYTENHVSLIGHIGNIEIRGADDNRAAVLSIATNKQWKDDDGNRHDRVNWTQCVAFRPATIGFIEKYLSKGRYVRITGELRTSTWDDNGETRYKTEVVIGRISPLDSRKGGTTDGAEDGDANRPDSETPLDAAG